MGVIKTFLRMLFDGEIDHSLNDYLILAAVGTLLAYCFLLFGSHTQR